MQQSHLSTRDILSHKHLPFNAPAETPALLRQSPEFLFLAYASMCHMSVASHTQHDRIRRALDMGLVLPRDELRTIYPHAYAKVKDWTYGGVAHFWRTHQGPTPVVICTLLRPDRNTQAVWTIEPRDKALRHVAAMRPYPLYAVRAHPFMELAPNQDVFVRMSMVPGTHKPQSGIIAEVVPANWHT
jgi:hypothetical protein